MLDKSSHSDPLWKLFLNKYTCDSVVLCLMMPSVIIVIFSSSIACSCVLYLLYFSLFFIVLWMYDFIIIILILLLSAYFQFCMFFCILCSYWCLLGVLNLMMIIININYAWFRHDAYVTFFSSNVFITLRKTSFDTFLSTHMPYIRL